MSHTLFTFRSLANMVLQLILLLSNTLSILSNCSKSARKLTKTIKKFHIFLVLTTHLISNGWINSCLIWLNITMFLMHLPGIVTLLELENLHKLTQKSWIPCFVKKLHIPHLKYKTLIGIHCYQKAFGWARLVVLITRVETQLLIGLCQLFGILIGLVHFPRLDF